MRFRFVCNRFIIQYYSAFHLKFQWAVWMVWCRLGSKEHKIVPLTYDFLLTFSLSSHIFILCHQSVPGMSSVACLIALWNIGNGMNCRWLNNLFRCGLSSLGRLQAHVESGWEILYKFSSDFLPRPFFLWLMVSSLTAEPCPGGFKRSQNRLKRWEWLMKAAPCLCYISAVNATTPVETQEAVSVSWIIFTDWPCAFK